MTYYLILQAGHLYLGTSSLQTPHSCMAGVNKKKSQQDVKLKTCWNHVLALGTFNSFSRRCYERFRCRVLRSRCPSPRVSVSVIRSSSSSSAEPNRRHAEVREPRSSARSASVPRELRARHQTRASPQQNLHQVHLEPEQQRTGVRLQAEAPHSDTGSADSVVRLRESAHWG